MDNGSGEQTSEQDQQASAQSTQMQLPPTAEQLTQFTASYHETRQKRKASEPFATEEEAPARRMEAPQSTGIHSQRSLAITAVDQIQTVHPALSGSSQDLSTADANLIDDDHIQPMTSALSTNPDLREQLREEIRKELELLCDSRLAKRTEDLETFWRGKREERMKEVESYWKQKLREAVSKDKDQNTRGSLRRSKNSKRDLKRAQGSSKLPRSEGDAKASLMDSINFL